MESGYAFAAFAVVDCRTNRSRQQGEQAMMEGFGMGFGMGLGWLWMLLVLVIVILTIAALIKYLRQ